MKKFALPALAAALALAACDSTPDDDAAMVDGETTSMDGSTTTMPAPTATETTVVTTPGTTTTTTDSGDRVTVSRDGVNADIGDGNTRVKANVDGDPSLTVETD